MRRLVDGAALSSDANTILNSSSKSQTIFVSLGVSSVPVVAALAACRNFLKR